MLSAAEKCSSDPADRWMEAAASLERVGAVLCRQTQIEQATAWERSRLEQLAPVGQSAWPGFSRQMSSRSEVERAARAPNKTDCQNYEKMVTELPVFSNLHNLSAASGRSFHTCARGRHEAHPLQQRPVQHGSLPSDLRRGGHT